MRYAEVKVGCVVSPIEYCVCPLRSGVNVSAQTTRIDVLERALSAACNGGSIGGGGGGGARSGIFDDDGGARRDKESVVGERVAVCTGTIADRRDQEPAARAKLSYLLRLGPNLLPLRSQWDLDTQRIGYEPSQSWTEFATVLARRLVEESRRAFVKVRGQELYLLMPDTFSSKPVGTERLSRYVSTGKMVKVSKVLTDFHLAVSSSSGPPPPRMRPRLTLLPTPLSRFGRDDCTTRSVGATAASADAVGVRRRLGRDDEVRQREQRMAKLALLELEEESVAPELEGGDPRADASRPIRGHTAPPLPRCIGSKPPHRSVAALHRDADGQPIRECNELPRDHDRPGRSIGGRPAAEQPRRGSSEKAAVVACDERSPRSDRSAMPKVADDWGSFDDEGEDEDDDNWGIFAGDRHPRNFAQSSAVGDAEFPAWSISALGDSEAEEQDSVQTMRHHLSQLRLATDSDADQVG